MGIERPGSCSMPGAPRTALSRTCDRREFPEAFIQNSVGLLRVRRRGELSRGDAGLRLLAEEDRIPAIRAMTNAGRAWHRSWVERTFAPLVTGSRGAARERRLVALVVATDILVWKLLRREMGLDRATAERIVIDMITSTQGAS